MPSLLYVTPGLLERLRQHPAYHFWWPFFQNQPIRSISLEERAFHPRPIKVQDGGIYLTVDMKFVYCRGTLLSFMYSDQDLSFRLNAKMGILRTLDNHQFSAIIGQVARVSDSTEIELVDADKVFHPWFDAQDHGSSSTIGAPMRPDPVKASSKSKARKTTPAAAPAAVPASSAAPAATPAPAPAPAVTAPAPAAAANHENGALVLGKFPRATCDEMVAFRTSSKKSYSYLAEKYGFSTADVKAICAHYVNAQRQAELQDQALQSELSRMSEETRDHILRLKQVSKKSYSYLADKFNLPVNTVKTLCAAQQKRPRRS